MSGKDALSYALKLLGIRDYFTEELRFKTARKFGEDEADKAVEALKGYGYLDDERAAANYIRLKLLSGYGPYYISGKLYERGCSVSAGDIIKKAGEEGIDLEEKIKSLAGRYMAGENPDPYKAWLKCMAFLRGRGYPGWLCDKTVKKGDFER